MSSHSCPAWKAQESVLAVGLDGFSEDAREEPPLSYTSHLFVFSLWKGCPSGTDLKADAAPKSKGRAMNSSGINIFAPCVQLHPISGRLEDPKWKGANRDFLADEKAVCAPSDRGSCHVMLPHVLGVTSAKVTAEFLQTSISFKGILILCWWC